MSELPRAVAIVGPTASGKSSLALALAERFGRSILCCDSVQVYRKLDIGSAKPSEAERRRVPHELLDLVEPDQVFSAGEYGRLAREHLERAPAIVCGGTGLYLRAAGWTHSGFEDEPSAGAAEARNHDRVWDRVGDRVSDHGHERDNFETSWMEREASEPGAVHRALHDCDPETAATIRPENVVRALRALWLCELHQEPISAVRKRDPPRPLLDILMIVLDPGVAAVDEAIDRRCEAMLTRGWVSEVENLVAAGYDAQHKAMRSLGYRELLDHLTNKVTGASSLEQATHAIKRATRKYARRQRTYFRHQFRTLLPMDRIVHIEHPEAVPIGLVAEFLQ
jgi:tRNA dimethylallyltransferase